MLVNNYTVYNVTHYEDDIWNLDPHVSERLVAYNEHMKLFNVVVAPGDGCWRRRWRPPRRGALRTPRGSSRYALDIDSLHSSTTVPRGGSLGGAPPGPQVQHQRQQRRLPATPRAARQDSLSSDAS